MATQPIHAMKACSKCGVEKPHDPEHFVTAKGRTTPRCRACHAAECKARWSKNRERYHATQRKYYLEHVDERKVADRLYREANPEKRREAHRRWREANPERVAYHELRYRESDAGKANLAERKARFRERHRDRLNAASRAAYYADYERHIGYSRKYEAENRDRRAEQQRQWRLDNKDKVRAWGHARRVKLRSGASFTDKDIGVILEEQDWQCSYCLADIEAYYEADHFIPVAKGGGNEPENIVLACLPCNRSKGARLPWDWRPDLFRPPE